VGFEIVEKTPIFYKNTGTAGSVFSDNQKKLTLLNR
jgi:hypothetical protein